MYSVRPILPSQYLLLNGCGGCRSSTEWSTGRVGVVSPLELDRFQQSTLCFTDEIFDLYLSVDPADDLLAENTCSGTAKSDSS